MRRVLSIMCEIEFDHDSDSLSGSIKNVDIEAMKKLLHECKMRSKFSENIEKILFDPHISFQTKIICLVMLGQLRGATFATLVELKQIVQELMEERTKES